MNLDNLNLLNFMDADVVCPAGKYTELGSYQCEAGLQIFYGQGTGQNFETALGRIYAELKDVSDAALDNMKLRLVIKDSQSIKNIVIGEYNAANLAQNGTDRRGWQPLPFNPSGIKEDSYLSLIAYNGNSASKTVDFENSTVLIDITKQLVG